jgi:hypothetical protein
MDEEVNMQIKSIHKMQDAFNKAIKLVKFAWRHFFVLNLLHCLAIAFIEAPSVNWGVFIGYLAVAVTLDWLKAKIKFSNSNHFDHYQAAIDSSRQYNEWATNPAKIGSPAHHIYNLGYNPGKYY